MTQRDRDIHQKRNEAADAGYNPRDYRGLQVHSNNTRVHEFVKWAVAMALDEEDRGWDSEVQMADGRVDIYDFGPQDGGAVVIEVETAVTPQRKQEKVDQYCKGPVRDVLVIDPDDVPLHPDEAVEWVKENILTGL